MSIPTKPRIIARKYLSAGGRSVKFSVLGKPTNFVEYFSYP
jgi:hypothetical protein